MLCYAKIAIIMRGNHIGAKRVSSQIQSELQLQQMKGKTDQDKRGVKSWHISAQY